MARNFPRRDVRTAVEVDDPAGTPMQRKYNFGKIKFAHSRPEVVRTLGGRIAKPVSESVRWKNESKLCAVDFRSVSYFNFGASPAERGGQFGIPTPATATDLTRRGRLHYHSSDRYRSASQPWTWSLGAFHEIRSDRAAAVPTLKHRATDIWQCFLTILPTTRYIGM